MIINVIKKKLFESLINEAISKIPEIKEMRLLYVKEHADEILEEVKKKIVELVKSKIGR